MVEVRGFLQTPDDVHVTFRFNGKPFVVLEPYGDSSRYWIGPETESESPIDVSSLEGEFSRG